MIQDEKLKKLRTELGLSQAEIAGICGIGQPAWSALEKGVNNISHPVAALLTNIFHVNPNWLFGQSDDMFLLMPLGEDCHSDRIAQYLNQKGITIRDASNAIGLLPHVVADIINTCRLTKEQLHAFKVAYPDLEIESPLTQQEKAAYEKRIAELGSEVDRYKKMVDALLSGK